MIGPTLLYYHKTFGTYLFFATSLIGLRPELQALQAFGTDGEKALANAFDHEYLYIAVRTESNNFDPEVSVPEDGFGTQLGEVFAKGLVNTILKRYLTTCHNCIILISVFQKNIIYTLGHGNKINGFSDI